VEETHQLHLGLEGLAEAYLKLAGFSDTLGVGRGDDDLVAQRDVLDEVA